MLPNGYACCLILCYIPPLWFKVMDPILEAYKNKEKVDKKILAESNSLLVKFIWSLFFFYFFAMIASEILKN